MTLTIDLHDGTQHTAQFTTLTAMMPLIKPMLREGEDLTTMTGDSADKILPRLFQGLGDADFIRDLANGLLTVFPTLPSDRVWFDDPSRPTPNGIAGLEITEIFMIIAKALEAVSQNGNLSLDKIAAYADSINPPKPEAVNQKAFVPSKKKKRR